jgi:hypothetical protein
MEEVWLGSHCAAPHHCADKSCDFDLPQRLHLHLGAFWGGPVTGERGELRFEPWHRDLEPWLDSSDEIPFNQFNTAVPEDVVGRGAVEIKVGQHEMQQIGLAFEAHCVFTKG